MATRKRHSLYGLVPPRPQDARRVIRKLFSRVAVKSCADGTFRIEARWRKKFSNPGVLTRMHAAYQIEALIRGAKS